MKVIVYYTIMINTPRATMQHFSIAFSEDNAPKDIWDHHDAVIDYLNDTAVDPFAPTPDFTIIKTIKE